MRNWRGCGHKITGQRIAAATFGPRLLAGQPFCRYFWSRRRLDSTRWLPGACERAPRREAAHLWSRRVGEPARHLAVAQCARPLESVAGPALPGSQMKPDTSGRLRVCVCEPTRIGPPNRWLAPQPIDQSGADANDIRQSIPTGRFNNSPGATSLGSALICAPKGGRRRAPTSSPAAPARGHTVGMRSNG